MKIDKGSGGVPAAEFPARRHSDRYRWEFGGTEAAATIRRSSTLSVIQTSYFQVRSELCMLLSLLPNEP